MKIGLLTCDHLDASLALEHGQYSDMFIRLLQTATPQSKFAVFDVIHDQWPAHEDVCDAWLITGSRHSVNDAFPWIRTLEQFVLNLHVRQKKVIGVCFGHQLIAKILGGRVIKSPKGWGVGMSSNQIIRQKPWMTPAREQVNLLGSHQEQVVELPLGAEILAATDFCPYYMLQIGNHLLTIQGHPEFSKAYSRALIKMREGIINAEQYEQGLASLRQDMDDELMAQWMINFISRPNQNSG